MSDRCLFAAICKCSISTERLRRYFRSSVFVTIAKLCAVCVVVCTGVCNAWNRGGHLVTGALAYEELEKSSPKALAELIAILPSHPAFSKWQSDLGDSPTVDRTKALLMLAAAFADDARIGQWKRFDKPNWHYVNFKYTPGQPLVDVLKTEPFNGKLLQALSANLTTYGDTSASLADRALAVS